MQGWGGSERVSEVAAEGSSEWWDTQCCSVVITCATADKGKENNFGRLNSKKDFILKSKILSLHKHLKDFFQAGITALPPQLLWEEGTWKMDQQ